MSAFRLQTPSRGTSSLFPPDAQQKPKGKLGNRSVTPSSQQIPVLRCHGLLTRCLRMQNPQMARVSDLQTTCTSKRFINAIDFPKANRSRSSCPHVFKLQLGGGGLKGKQAGQGFTYVSISSFGFLLNVLARGQLWTRRDSQTSIRRLLTHLAHLYSSENGGNACCPEAALTKCKSDCDQDRPLCLFSLKIAK